MEHFMSTNNTMLGALVGLLICLTLGWAITVYGYRRLRHTLKQQQAKEQRMQGFMASLSHHLRTPLNGIMGYAEYIHSSSQEPMVHFTSKIILENSLQMLHLVNGLLDLSKIQEGSLDLSQSDFDINDMVESVRALHQARADELKISLHVYLAPQLPSQLRADPYRVRQVLNNLVDNALNYNRPQGSVTLSVTPAPMVYGWFFLCKIPAEAFPLKCKRASSSASKSRITPLCCAPMKVLAWGWC